MNTANFQQTGGFPLETETLDFMQTSYGIFNALGEIVGQKSIIKGCNTVGSTVTDGVIYWNGELLEFRGGATQSKIVILEEVVSVPFENGAVNDTYYKRYATFGTGIGAEFWTAFVRAYPLTSAVFVDEIKMFAGDVNSLPFGWHLCDGANGTVNLKGKFIVGYDPTDTDYDNIGDTGGAKEVTLTEGQMPSHQHSGNVTLPDHSHKMFTSTNVDISENKLSNYPERFVSVRGYGEGSANHDYTMGATVTSATLGKTSADGGGNTSITTNSSGGGEAHENRPPFYTLAYIQFKGI